MGKLICMGDCIADMLPDGAGSLTYTAKMGGAPANVCVAAAKLGVQACFLGKLADDAFGRFLLAELKSYGVDTSLTVIDKHCKTGLAFVALSSDGDREFFFYRDTPADASLSPDEVKEDIFGRDDVLHFCSISLKPSPTCDAIRKAAETARKKGATVSFDVNLRLNLWDNDETALRRTVFEFFPYADIIKITDEELLFLAGTTDEKRESENTRRGAKRPTGLCHQRRCRGFRLFARPRLPRLSRGAAQSRGHHGCGRLLCGRYRVLSS